MMKQELLSATFVEMCLRYQVTRSQHFHLQIFALGHEGRLHRDEVNALKCVSSRKLTSDAHNALNLSPYTAQQLIQ